MPPSRPRPRPLAYYRWHGLNEVRPLPEFRDPWIYHGSAISAGALGVILALPPVSRALGIDGLLVLAMMATWVAWMEVAAWFVVPRARDSLAGMRVLSDGNLYLGCVLAAGLPVLTRDPATPLWVLPVTFACFNGSALELDPAFSIAGAHLVSVLLAIPAFVALGVPLVEAAPVPIAIAVLSLFVYHQLTVRTLMTREALAERDVLRAQLELERSSRLARDLHDAVGANLSSAAVLADVLERTDDPDAARELAGAISTASRQALVELRAVLEGLAPEDVDSGTLAAALRAYGATLVASAGIDLAVTTNDGTARIEASARGAILRVFQEALQNVLKHAHAKRVTVAIEMASDCIVFEMTDDGRGFDVGSPRAGRGLGHFAARAAELGGRADVRSSASGTTISIHLPRRAPVP